MPYVKDAFGQCELLSSLRALLFASCRQHSAAMHARHVYDLIGTFVESLEGPLRPGYYVRGVHALVAAHLPLAAAGFDGEAFERLGVRLVDMLACDEFVSTCPDGKRAWM